MRIARRILGLILLLALAWTGLVLSERFPLRTPAQQTALDLLERDPQRARGERDAYPLLWLFNYELPEAELGAVLQADVQRFADQIQRRVVALDYSSSAEGKYPAIPTPPGNDPRLCQPWNDDCLQRVRADVEASGGGAGGGGNRACGGAAPGLSCGQLSGLCHLTRWRFRRCGTMAWASWTTVLPCAPAMRFWR